MNSSLPASNILLNSFTVELSYITIPLFLAKFWSNDIVNGPCPYTTFNKKNITIKNTVLINKPSFKTFILLSLLFIFSEFNLKAYTFNLTFFGIDLIFFICYYLFRFR